MKEILIVFLFFTLIYGCESTQKVTEKGKEISQESRIDTIKIENEELEYEIIILDIGFNNWLMTQRPMSYYTVEWLEIRNKFYVAEWNRRVLMPGYYDPNLYMQMIDYQPTVEYGLEVNYMLYMYFEFFQQRYNQRLR